MVTEPLGGVMTPLNPLDPPMTILYCFTLQGHRGHLDTLGHPTK